MPGQKGNLATKAMTKVITTGDSAMAINTASLPIPASPRILGFTARMYTMVIKVVTPAIISVLRLNLFSVILKNKKINSSESYVEKVVSLIKERAVFVKDFWSLSSYFFKTPEDYDEKASKKQWKEGTSVLMNELIIVLASINDFSSKTIEETVKSWISSKEIGFGKIMQPLRLAIVGEMKGPHLFDIIDMIGKDEAVLRIKKIIKTLS